MITAFAVDPSPVTWGRTLRAKIGFAEDLEEGVGLGAERELETSDMVLRAFVSFDNASFLRSAIGGGPRSIRRTGGEG